MAIQNILTLPTWRGRHGWCMMITDDHWITLIHKNLSRAIAIVVEVVRDIYRAYYGQKASWQLMRLTS